MNFTRFAKKIEGLQYLADKMELSGSRVRRYLMQSTFCTRPDILQTDFDILQKALDILSVPGSMPEIMQLRHLFTQVHDIQGTLHALKEQHILDEVELFEIKYFAALCTDFHKVCGLLGFHYENLHDLQEVQRLLDPHGAGTVSFYLYDCYSQSLSRARELATSIDPDREPEKWNSIQDRIREEELAVREMLSTKLSGMYPLLRDNFDRIAHIEIWFAKANLAKRYGMVRPCIAVNGPDDAVLCIENMINPQIADTLGTINKEFQPVSVTLKNGPCLLTGANMSGKTVVLKTLALIQTLTQFSFFVPAQSASIPLVKDVFLVIGDKQDQYRGLSSFAAEMLQLDRIMADIRQGIRLLLLVDEPARTTNPAEGAAILCALVEFLEHYNTMSLISTHYGDLGLSCRKLRVSGFNPVQVKGRLDPLMMNEYMDYSLTEDKEGSVPMEALRIARLLGVDDAFIESAQRYVK
jgi:DNA mismatch repair protein MutS2